MRISIHGRSDDLVYVCGCAGGDKEFNVNTDRPIAGSFVIGGVIRVLALYQEGCWSFAVGQVEEEIPIPSSWDVRIVQSDCQYSVLVEIDVGDSVLAVMEEK